MQYVTTAERIGIEKGEKISRKEGVLIGEILMAQRVLKQPIYSHAELETKSLKELKKFLLKPRLACLLHKAGTKNMLYHI